MGLQCHSDLLCEFILQELYRKFGVIFKFVSYVFAIKMYHLSYHFVFFFGNDIIVNFIFFLLYIHLYNNTVLDGWVIP